MALGAALSLGACTDDGASADGDTEGSDDTSGMDETGGECTPDDAMIAALDESACTPDANDYQPTVNCQTMAAGRTSATITVNVRGDRKREANERLSLLVGGILGLRLADPVAIGTIVNDD